MINYYLILGRFTATSHIAQGLRIESWWCSGDHVVASMELEFVYHARFGTLSGPCVFSGPHAKSFKKVFDTPKNNLIQQHKAALGRCLALLHCPPSTHRDFRATLGGTQWTTQCHESNSARKLHTSLVPAFHLTP